MCCGKDEVNVKPLIHHRFVSVIVPDDVAKGSWDLTGVVNIGSGVSVIKVK